MIKAVVIDVDDTVYLERDYVRSGFNAVDRYCMSETGTSDVGVTAWRLFEQGTRNTTLSEALEARGLPGTGRLLAACIEVYRTHDPKIRLTQDSERFIAAARGFARMAVVTDGAAESQRAKCHALGLDSVAERLVVTSEHGTSKPDPYVFTLAIQGWDVRGAEVLWVADNPAKDFETPLAFGWHAVRIVRRGALHERAPTPDGVATVHSLDELLHMLNGLSS